MDTKATETYAGKGPSTGPDCAESAGSTILPLRGLWAIIDPKGNIVHTHIGTRKDKVIASWMDEEQTLMHFLRGKSAQSWECYEADGYRTALVDLIPSNSRD